MIDREGLTDFLYNLRFWTIVLIAASLPWAIVCFLM